MSEEVLIDKNNVTHLIYQGENAYCVTMCGKYSTDPGMLASHMPSAHLCSLCKRAHNVKVPNEVPGLCEADHMEFFNLIKSNQIDDDFEVFVLDRFNQLYRELPKEVSNLIQARLRMERDFIKSLRCGVCGRRSNPRCAREC